MLHEINEKSETLTMKNRVKNVFANKKVQFGIAIAVTAVVSALIARSEIFQPRFTMDEVSQLVDDMLADAELIQS
jgi:hypothetical protein